MAKDESRRATPRTGTNTKNTAPTPQKASQGSAKASGKAPKAPTKRVVLAEPDKAEIRKKSADPAKVMGVLARIFIALVVVFALGVISFYVLRFTSAFSIASIDTEATEHLTEQDIANLAGVTEGTTLLNIDEGTVVENLKRNPWVLDATVEREFPDKLRIEVHERKIDTLVLMSTSAFAWYIGEGDVWLEPATLDLSEGRTAKEAAQLLATQKGALLVIDVPATVNPSAGQEVSDEVLLAVGTYVRELPEELSSEIVYFSASSLESISCILSSGVEVSLGAPQQIEQKVAVLTQILEQYPGEITYVNVRVPSSPTYRRIDSDAVQPGSGA